MEVKIYRPAQSPDLFVEAIGRIVLDACETLKSAVLPHLTPQIDTLHVDLSQVDFIDSAGLGVLVGIKMMANRCKARMLLVAPSKNVYDILYVSKLENIFDIVTGQEAELLRTSLAAPEHLVQHAVGRQEPAAAPPAARPPLSAVSSVGVEDRTVGPPTAPPPPAVPAAPPRTPVPVNRPVPHTSPTMPIHEPRPAAQEKQAPRGDADALDDICKQALELMRQGLYEKAARKYEEALAIDPDYLPALNNLAIVYEKKPSWYPKAREQWQRVLEISESHGDQKHAKRARKHLENLDKLA
ncbi:MAG: hypothetical protein Kow0059_11470 [Candidatus Sumerlaeia bacterium]